MGDAKRKSVVNRSTSYLQLDNKNLGSTYPVSVDHTFLSDLFDLEKSYASDSVVMFRKNSHPLRKFHVTGTTIRFMMTISRRFNTEGTLAGCPLHRLYQLMAEEYEESCTKEQFYAEAHKLIALGILSVSRSGIIDEWKLESYKRDTRRFVLFHPLVFTAAFTDLPIAAQKLYLYIVNKNGEKLKHRDKELLGRHSWLYTLTHKSRPAQIRELLQSLSALEINGQRLFLECSVEKDALGRWAVHWVLNPTFVVQHVPGAHYRMVPKAKVPYSQTVSRLRQLFSFNRISEVEQLGNGNVFLNLVQLLHHASMKVLRFAAARIRELIIRYGLHEIDLVSMLTVELEDRSFVAYMEVVKETGAYGYLDAFEEEGVYAEARPLQFFRAIKDKFSIREFAKVCSRAVSELQERYGKQPNTAISLKSMNGHLFTESSHHEEAFYLEDFLLELESNMNGKVTE
ncbi:hypothetical protein SAMN03159341_102510 [Paenibacillus sp. 1_12]|uniref:hypothetical protein n=1 Tax=Paenibacillus sp. 1_12 TaxID=1566278 RepID=UPI0008EF4DA2|nr:hypothetical protein [Paenibacillus sp. 1_12]SFK97894.1 hypothetical protein SAMN03159341_102510 [Paenibacillus sp. 1_12]